MSRILTVPYTELAALPPHKGVMYSPRLLTTLEWTNVRSAFLFQSVVDSGADYCVFPANFGDRLGIDIKSGKSVQMSGFGGEGQCFYHEVNVLVIIDNRTWRFKCFAGFSEQMNELGVGLLGRHGFFELFEEVIFDQRNKIFKLRLPSEQPLRTA